MNKKSLLGATALRTIALGFAATYGTSAFAQEATGTQSPAATESAASPGSIEEDPRPQAEIEPAQPPVTSEDDDTIVVTGSRIARTEATSASPLQIVDPTIAQRQGRLDTAEMIQNSPIAAGSLQITTAISINSVSNGGPGANTISLRGLGAERTLVLLNSRRAGPAGTRGGVSSFDLNVLPQSVIRSVEILKDGASSVYGSDAIAGVVNLITKRKTDGLELGGFSSVPIESGGENYGINAAWGKEFSRGHILVAGDLYRRNELERRDRDFLGCGELYRFRPDTNQRADLIDPRTGRFACTGDVVWGHVWTYGARNLPNRSLTLLQFNYPGDNLQNYIPGVQTPALPGDIGVPAGWFPVGYQTANNQTRVPVTVEQRRLAVALTNYYHPFEQKSSVSPQVDRVTAYADGSFKLTDNIELYAEGLFNRRKTYEDSFTQIYNFGYTSSYAPGDPDDPFPGFTNPRGGQTYVSPTGIIDQYDRKYTVDYARGVAGVRGGLFGDWRYDVYGQYSKSKGKYWIQQVLGDSIYQQSLRGYGYGCAGLFTEIEGKPCLQINWVSPSFLAGDLTQAEQDYLLGDEEGRTDYIQKFAEATVSGTLLQLPAGPLGIAAGAVIRQDSIDDVPGRISRALVPGGDPNNEDDYVDNGFSNDFASGRTFGRQVTREAFGEVNLPIFRNAPFAKSFTLSGAARVTDVIATRGGDGAKASSKGNWTYKLTGNWQVTDWVRLRGTYGTSYRAPALFEQFLTGQVSGATQGATDPCILWAQNLANNAISQRVADNCAADGIPGDHTGAGIQISVFSEGGLGILEPETSRAKTASIIFTPRFSALPNTQLDLTVDYFNIKVEGQIDRLTAGAIVRGCYNSDNFPNDPLCSLFERGQDGNPFNIRNVFSKFINIDEQINSGIDITARLRQGMGSLGRLSLLFQATRQLKDRFTRLGQTEELNGEVGDPKWTADLSATWDIRNTTLYYNTTYVGKWSSVEDYREVNPTAVTNSAGQCFTNPNSASVQVYGPFCVRPYAPAVFYHNASISQRVLNDKFELTLGVNNILNTRPPRVSGVTTLGQVPLFASQYDWFGRRVFVNAKARF